ncbi:MAG: nitroreductase family protein [archaeon]|nr:nitroreductase family protein [archaeon]
MVNYKNLTIVSLFTLFCFCLSAIKLPDPDKVGGTPLYAAAAMRKSERDFTDDTITQRELSQLLWSAYGYNDLGAGHRTVPSSEDMYEFDIYAFTKDGAYLYDPQNHEIELKLSGDHRAITGKDDYVSKAAVNICIVGVYERAKYPYRYIQMLAFNLDSGFVSQSMYYTCLSENLKCVAREKIESSKILELLGLNETDYHVPLCFSAGR